MKQQKFKPSRITDKVRKFYDYLVISSHLSSSYIRIIPMDHRKIEIRSGSNLFPRSFIRSPLWLFASCVLSISMVFTGDLYNAFITGYQAIHLYDDFFPIRVGLVMIGIGIYMLWFLYLEEKLCTYEAFIQVEKIKKLSNEKKLLESRLKLLKAQVEPHFLFNTLTSIVSLDDTDPEKAKAMHINFMQYLDETFNKMRSDKTTVGQEIKLIKSYLDIFKIRMGRRLTYEIQMEPYINEISFPSMLIQPIVENAIKHGLEPKVTGGKITISAEIEGKRLIWHITDTGVGISNNSDLGIGLGNVIDRLESLYGSDAELTVEEHHPTGTKVTIEVPYA
jgi:hypothetical protein